MTQEYLSPKEVKAIFDAERLHVTQGVTVLLKIAAKFANREREFKSVAKNGMADEMKHRIKDAETNRVRYIWKAIDLAEAEKDQRWRFIEDRKHYMDDLNDRYGDLDFVNKSDDLKKLATIYELCDLQKALKGTPALEQLV